MIEQNYDPTRPYRFVSYGRMSTDGQNKRSPDQQFDTIEDTIARNRYPWICVNKYRDDGISGRKVSGRPGLQAMLQDIESGRIDIDLLVLDTFERFGRNDQMTGIRQALRDNHGTLIVTADNNFADPTGIAGMAIGFVDQMRSTENTRICSHNVKRGKKDAVRRGRWPGGPSPFGYRLKRINADSVNFSDIYHVLEPDPRESLALKLLFERADQTGEGAQRLSKWWNGCAEISADFKPCSVQTTIYRLKNKIALGVLVWGKNQTDMVDDTRILKPNPDGAEELPGFCEPVISVELFERVQSLLRARSSLVIAKRRSEKEMSPTKLIAPLSQGIVLKYFLTGLVKCGACKASMRAVPSGKQSKAKSCYVYYMCPRHLEGACDNHHYVPEDRLRAAVISRLRARLFPQGESEGQIPKWFPQIMQWIQEELDRIQNEEPDRARANELEIQELNQKLSGWMQSLSDSNISSLFRTDIMANYEQASQRKRDLEQWLASQKASASCAQRILDPNKVIEALRHLDEVLAGSNPMLTNLELSRHIERIDCFPNGRVAMRGMQLGLFDGAIELLSRDNDAPIEGVTATSSKFAPIVARRRGRLKVPNLSANAKENPRAANATVDPSRFVGLSESFFWTEPIVLEKHSSWAKLNASDVVKLRAEGVTMEKMAKHFGKTPPTLRSALKIGKLMLPELKLPKKVTQGRWFEARANDVMKLRRQGLSTAELAAHFGKSNTTILAAVKFARTPAPDASHANEVQDADSNLGSVTPSR